MLAPQVKTLAHRKARCHVYWHVGTLARKLGRHESTLARRPRWHAGTHGIRFSKVFDLPSLWYKTLGSSHQDETDLNKKLLMMCF